MATDWHNAQLADGHRSWTGRSVVSRATETALSRYVTAGTRQTRVSAMRFARVRARSGSSRAAVGAARRFIPSAGGIVGARLS
jgi:hypothetical protein